MWGNRIGGRTPAAIIALTVVALVVPGTSPASAATGVTETSADASPVIARSSSTKKTTATERPGRRLAKGKGKRRNRPPAPTTPPAPDLPPAPSADVVATLLKTIDLSVMRPPSPDASDVAYDPNTDRLIVVDGEIDEPNMAWLYQGVNIFNLTRQGVFMSGGSTTLPNPLDFSREPVGASFIPATNTLLISDDNQDDLSFVKAGGDSKFGTADDVVSERKHVIRAFAGDRADPEGVAFDTVSGDIWIVDGVNAEVWRWNKGANGRFDDTVSGATTTAGIDDVFTHFDTAVHGLTDAEGIAVDEATNTLLCLSVNGNLIYRFGKAGTLIETIDISGAGAIKPSGIVLAPSSLDPTKTSVWITDRGIDNGPLGTEPTTENDGKLFEMKLGTGTTPTTTTTQTLNLAPTVRISSPTASTAYTTEGTMSLSGTARDPEGTATSLVWRSSIDGRLGTGKRTSTQLSAGTHVITLKATDRSGRSAAATVRITVTEPAPEMQPATETTATTDAQTTEPTSSSDPVAGSTSSSTDPTPGRGHGHGRGRP